NFAVTLTAQFTHWVQGTTTASFGAGITVVSLTVTSPTSATATINIDTSAVAGSRNITVTTSTEVVQLTDGFVVLTCLPAPSGLVSWWTGDGSTGDLFGLNNPSASNAVTFIPGKVGQGFTFGPGGYIWIPPSARLAN